MIKNEFGSLGHGEKIKGPDGTIYIVHNNCRLGGGVVVATRSVVIPYQHCRDWKRVSKFKDSLVPGIYQVTIEKKLD